MRERAEPCPSDIPVRPIALHCIRPMQAQHDKTHDTLTHDTVHDKLYHATLYRYTALRAPAHGGVSKLYYPLVLYRNAILYHTIPYHTKLRAPAHGGPRLVVRLVPHEVCE